MAKYLIHACNSRLWYVNEYLVPSMIRQGICPRNIHIYNDKMSIGNLKAFLESLNWILKNWKDDEGVWHLQDDVIVSHDFKEQTEKYDKGMVYGFQSEYDKKDDLWYSFPCIRIKNSIIPGFLFWLDMYAPKDSKTSYMIPANKYDDALMMEYLRGYYHDYILRVSPNIVDHVDWLIGGSTVNQQRRKKIVRSIDWKDEYLVEELKEKLNAST